MKTANRLLALSAVAFFAVSLHAADIPHELPDPDNKPPAADRPVKVFLLMGQSNMVGMGDISGGSARWGKQSPRNQGYHYNRNAETYMLVGDALGRAMAELLDATTLN